MAFMLAKSDRAVHPFADLFPLMDEHELAELARDIEVNGLRFPIIIDGDGAIIDGRNRIRACHIARVEPRFETLADGIDPVAFIVSLNIARRHLTAGQRAMLIAIAYPNPEKGGRGNKKRAEETSSLFSAKRLQQARRILRESRTLADKVVSGALSIDDAMKQVDDDERVANSAESQMAQLQKDAPDLAELVGEQRLALADALAATNERRAQQREQREAIVRVTNNVVANVLSFDSASFREAATECFTDDDMRNALLRLSGGTIEPDKLDRACAAFTSFMRERFASC